MNIICMEMNLIVVIMTGSLYQYSGIFFILQTIFEENIPKLVYIDPSPYTRRSANVPGNELKWMGF